LSAFPIVQGWTGYNGPFFQNIKKGTFWILLYVMSQRPFDPRWFYVHCCKWIFKEERKLTQKSYPKPKNSTKFINFHSDISRINYKKIKINRFWYEIVKGTKASYYSYQIWDLRIKIIQKAEDFALKITKVIPQKTNFNSRQTAKRRILINASHKNLTCITELKCIKLLPKIMITTFSYHRLANKLLIKPKSKLSLKFQGIRCNEKDNAGQKQLTCL
jgi:hypothetical protein